MPPATALAPLAAAVDRLPPAAGLRWTARPGWHLTLAFYGEVPEATVPDLTERLARAARHTPAFPLALHGGGHFGDRALWAGVAGDVTELGHLAERAVAAGRRAGLPGEHRRYRPHLTLARNAAGGPGLAPYASALGAFESPAWTVSELALVRSRLPVSGVAGERPHYEKVAGWPLAQPR
nr:RNA 2',3'-cyclic phosphodiesterase [Streptomyces sp. SID5785]